MDKVIHYRFLCVAIAVGLLLLALCTKLTSNKIQLFVLYSGTLILNKTGNNFMFIIKLFSYLYAIYAYAI